MLVFVGTIVSYDLLALLIVTERSCVRIRWNNRTLSTNCSFYQLLCNCYCVVCSILCVSDPLVW